VAKQISSPRNLEANLLLEAAARLQAVRDDWSSKRPNLDHALRYNRRLWTVFLTSVTHKDNPLPKEIRQNVANLGLFVMKQTIALIGDPKPDQLGSLININREIAGGLLARN
jgi:flagellar biosynthesis activator protein FlaF